MDWNENTRDPCQEDGHQDDQQPMRSMEAESPPSVDKDSILAEVGMPAEIDAPDKDDIPDFILLRAENIIFGYRHNLRRCSELREELDNLQLYTWQDAFEVLSGHGAQDSERVQTSNTPDPTFKIAANIDKKLYNMNRGLVREIEDELHRATSAVAVMDTVLIRLELLKHDPDYRNTAFVAQQICLEERKPEEIKDQNGWRMRRKAVCEELEKITRLTAEELMGKKL